MRTLEGLLVERVGLGLDALARARKDREERGGGLAAALVRLGLVDENELLEEMAAVFGFPRVDLREAVPDPTLRRLVPSSLARRHRIVAVRREGSTLIVATADPTDRAALDAVRFRTGCEVRVALAPSTEIDRALGRLEVAHASGYVDTVTDLRGQKRAARKDDEDDAVVALERAGEAPPIVRLVDAILAEAVARRASDIHLEPYERELRVRFRVDGVLREVLEPPAHLFPAIASRLKIMSGLDISERRRPQEGRIRARSEGRDVQFRVSVLPIAYGEKIVLRILDTAHLRTSLADLGLDDGVLATLRRALDRPWGMVLVTGPTGSGKTTTLYAALSEINDPSRNVASVEDPIELNLRGINQVSVNEAIGVTFSSTLRALLRQDPDVIFVGEIRDRETAEIAVRAAMTGHLVLSTLHTQDAASAATRLVDMGVDPFLVVGAVHLVLAQRLVRKVCVACAGKGCDECGRSGYRGRIGVVEALEIDDEIRERILARGAPHEIRRLVLARGGATLRDSGMAKVRSGLTTLAEVLRVTGEADDS